jgi:hypothetical protein
MLKVPMDFSSLSLCLTAAAAVIIITATFIHFLMERKRIDVCQKITTVWLSILNWMHTQHRRRRRDDEGFLLLILIHNNTGILLLHSLSLSLLLPWLYGSVEEINCEEVSMGKYESCYV